MKIKFGLLPRIILAIVLGVVLGSFVPENVVKFFATFNGLFGGFLGFAIPLIIIGFIVPGIAHLGKGAGKLLGVTTTTAYVSTIIAGTLAFTVGSLLLPGFVENTTAGNVVNPGEALLGGFFELEIPPIMGVMSALIFAFVLGIGISATNSTNLRTIMDEFQRIIEKLITYVIIPLLPIHILGIFMNMTYGGQVQSILSVFAKVFILIIALHITMLLLQYTTAGVASGKNPLRLIRTMLPAYFTALGTQSSAATIPVTLQSAKKTGVNEKIAEFAVPLFATIHLSGSMITLVSCSMGVILLTGGAPSLSEMGPFILLLGVMMIAAPGVPGGAVMAAAGLLETMLGFDPTMVSLMIALYLAQDSFGTATNVTGDGALTVLVDKFSGAKS
ncbi:Na+/H+-dicarboxylate symporter [Chryseomicrobium aureum]|uniref:dicarboxylate/amino acid:cation symporter n=1 Tax=Chryseomicrobium aureum TaxID=1441723 RepID=UPI001956894D|nr:dicarboxylate/amino acid:cation symporter [Chryseomicrobium aureum]MBM7706955.1 Na+/H+-dicarboxylate symporter [Chryseomicrobium aureum]